MDEHIQEEMVEEQGSPDLYGSIRAHYKEGVELTDDEIDTIADVAVGYLKSILNVFGETTVVIEEFEGDEGELILDVSKGDLAILIGRHGRTLDALQLIVSSLVSRKLGFHYPVVVDVEGYKDRRKQKVMNIAKSAADKARRRGEYRMAPMSAYERRLVHIALREDDSVTTHSEGDEPERYVVVTAR